MKKTTKESFEDEVMLFARMGRAAMLPGLIHAREILDRAIEQMRGDTQITTEPREVKNPRRVKAQRSAWTNMSAEERSKEMIRRRKVAEKNKAAKLKGAGRAKAKYDAEWRANVSKAAKERWARMSKTERANHVAKLAAARRLKAVAA